MKINLMRSAVMVTSLVLAGSVFGQDPSTHLAFDSASNYGGDNPWNNDSNQGFGFGAWVLTDSTAGNSGHFVGNPASGGIAGMSETSFGLFANNSSDSFANADRTLSSSLGIGDVFSFDWGVNWDSDGGNKGFNLYVGGTGGTQIINVNHGSTQEISINDAVMFNEYGTQVMTFNFERVSATDLRVSVVGRNSIESYDNTFSFSDSAIDAFRFYASNLQGGADGDNRQPYFNNLAVIPEPSSILMVGLAGLAAVMMLRRKRG